MSDTPETHDGKTPADTAPAVGAAFTDTADSRPASPSQGVTPGESSGRSSGAFDTAPGAGPEAARVTGAYQRDEPFTFSAAQPPRKPSFRRRRPVLFFFLLACAVFVCVWAVLAAMRAAEAAGPRLGEIKVEGFIGDAERVVTWAEELRRDTNVLGVLVRVDSPGGGVGASQEMYAAVKRLAEAKPVVVSMGSVAASGGYYVAVAGKEIFASPSTLTGSIGVRVQLTNVQALMDKIGVTSRNLTTGKFKDAGDPFKPLSEEERLYLMGLLEDMQDEFVATVAKGRSLAPEKVKPYADGRVLTGRQALKAGLVDTLGDRHAALERLKVLCKLTSEKTGGKDIPVISGPETREPFWKRALSAALELDGANTAAVSRYSFMY